MIYSSAGSLTGLVSHPWNPFVNSAQENSEKKRKKKSCAFYSSSWNGGGWVGEREMNVSI